MLKAVEKRRAHQDIVKQIRALIEKGFAYERNGSVFFSVTDWPCYGKLSGRKIEELEEEIRRLEKKPGGK